MGVSLVAKIANIEITKQQYNWYTIKRNVDVAHVYQDQESYIFQLFVNILKILCKQIWLRGK